jgi:hypothetical protein
MADRSSTLDQQKKPCDPDTEQNELKVNISLTPMGKLLVAQITELYIETEEALWLLIEQMDDPLYEDVLMKYPISYYVNGSVNVMAEVTQEYIQLKKEMALINEPLKNPFQAEKKSTEKVLTPAKEVTENQVPLIPIDTPPQRVEYHPVWAGEMPDPIEKTLDPIQTYYEYSSSTLDRVEYSSPISHRGRVEQYLPSTHYEPTWAEKYGADYEIESSENMSKRKDPIEVTTSRMEPNALS